MNLLMIASIQKNGKVIGMRLLDTDLKGGKFMDVPIDSIKEVIQTAKAEICNLGISQGNVIGTNGIIERYPSMSPSGTLINNGKTLIVINQIGDAGYTVVDYKGSVKRARTSDVVEYAKGYGIANGKVVIKDSIEFISSINGSYNIEKVSATKVKTGTDDVKIHIALSNKNRATDSVSKHVNMDVNVEIEDSDVFKDMTKQQKEVIKNYYVWYTVDKYKSLAKSVRLSLDLGKAERLSELRGIEEWEFAGIEDAGFMGGAKCELGHNLRYMFYAVPANDRDNEDARIVFGEQCSADFFNISSEDMKKLVKTRKIMSEEIRIIADIIAQGEENVYMNKTKLLYSFMRKLSTKENILSAFGDKIGSTLIQFIMVKIPFPMSLVLEASNKISKDTGTFLHILLQEHTDTLMLVFDKNNKSAFVRSLNEYLKFLVTNKVEGDYAYNPLDSTIKRTDIGGYNKNTRNSRRHMLSEFRSRAMCDKFTLEEVDKVLTVLSILTEYRVRIENKIGGVGKLDTSLKLKDMAKEYANLEDTANRLIINNALATYSEDIRYSCRMLQYHEDRNYVCIQTSVDELYDSIKGIEDKFDSILDDFYIYVNEKRQEKDIKEQEKREREEQIINERREREDRDNREKHEREEREKHEQKEQVEHEDKIETLKSLMEKHEIKDDYGVETAKAIIEKCDDYNSLSARQKWRIDSTIKKYVDLENGVKQEDENKTYSLSEHKDIQSAIDKIIDNIDNDKMKEVLKSVPSAVKIAKSILKYGRASDKQLKHINKAVELLNLA